MDAPALRPPRVAVIGCGYWGRNLVRNFAELGALDALVDSSAERIADLVARHGGRGAAYDQVLADRSIDAVAVATPGPAHFGHAMAALEAGKHVYVEKPLTLSSSDSERLVERAEANGLTLMVGHILRHHPAFVRLEEMALAGTIGRVRHVVSTRLAMGKILKDEDALWALAPHDLSMVITLLGPEPERVHCIGDAFLRRGVADTATLRLVYAEGASAEIRVSWFNPFKEQKLVAIGDAGSIVFDDTLPWDQKLTLRRPALDWADPAVLPDPGPPEAVPLPPGEPLKAECRDFLESVSARRRPRTDGREGLVVTRLLERAAASMAAGGVAR